MAGMSLYFTFLFYFYGEGLAIKYGTSKTNLLYGQIIATLEIIGIIAALKFMFDFRKTK